MKTEYHGTEIEYDERANHWVFTLRGRERFAESLKLAKEAIDKPAPKNKKPFTRYFAWHSHYSDPWRQVVVTSVAETPAWRGDSQEAWVQWDKNRTKVKFSELFPVNVVNSAYVDAINAIEKQIEGLTKDKEKIEKKMVAALPPKPETADTNEKNKTV